MKKFIKIISIMLLIIQILTIIGNFKTVNANIKEGDNVILQGDHECDSLVEYEMDNGRWSYKIVWYVYYLDEETGNKYPAFCVEPAKEGIGTGYDSYTTTISKETDNAIWRILSKGYMGSKWTDWDVECDDDFYSATKIALHSYAEGINPTDKYVLGDREVDGNSIEDIQRRGQKVLDLAQALYDYGINGTDKYSMPQVDVYEDGKDEIEEINGKKYYIQNYKVNSNRKLKSYSVVIENFVEGTKILNSNNQEISNLEEDSFKIAIPIEKIKNDIKGKIFIKNVQVRTCPVYYAQSSIDEAQSYVTYSSKYEIAETSTELGVKASTAKLSILKIDSETKKPLENVTFRILNEKDEKIGDYTTNKDGIIELSELKPGIVKIKEIKVDDKYVLDSEERIVKLNYGEETKIEISNNRAKGQIKIIKTSESDNTITGEKAGSPIANVEFEIRNIEGKLIETITTNEKGEAITSKLNVGEYSVKETKVNENYYLDETEYVLKIEKDGEINILNLTNKPKEKLPRTGF